MSQQEKIEARAALYKILSQGFRYPTRELVEHLQDKDYWEQLIELLAMAGLSAEVIAGVTQKDILYDEAVTEGLEGFEIEYNRLFQLASETPCPLTASEYMSGEARQAVAVAQLNGLYRSFGVAMNATDYPDNISVILEFLVWLCAKELRARASGDEYKSDTCLKAERTVLEDYLGWIPLLAEPLKTRGTLKFYPWLANCLVEFLKEERKSLLTVAV
ncbi:MAG: molecular chaperone TorD family protein [Candidatus Melainabacteria bacterium]|nr:molecular chaperone TorD family protein [Candidatus Melainabacteria bacterium]